jgi:hypothetical protein
MTVFRDLSQHILDIAENSVAAEADLLHIDISEDLEADRLSIVIRDNGRGMTPDVVARVTDPWVTTRTTRKVGLGIPFLKQTAEMCGGSFEIASKLRDPKISDQGTITRAAFQLSHIDRPPLGDVIGTLLCIIVGNPQLNVVYHHRVGNGEFEFDTREIREILGDDVPFSDPEVLGFIRGALAEGLAAIGGEAAPSGP